MNLRRLFLYMLIASVSLSALIGIGVILFGDFGEIEVRVLMTTLTVTVTSIFGLACGAYLESGRGKYLPLAGIAFSIIAALMAFLVIWNVLDDSKPFIKSFLTGALLAAACSHLSLLSLARLDRRFSWTRIAASVCIWLLMALLLYIIWFEPHGDSDVVYRILGVLGILLASITVVTPVLHKLSSADDDLEKIENEIAELESRLGHLRDQKEAILNSVDR
jgi:intracellular septation protein A